METKVHIKGLNGFRFLAAFAVFITHVELMKANSSIPNIWSNEIILALGGIGVVFFFTLSGFLITHLLLLEISKTQTVSIKKFYFRRILRIWPLYFLITGIGFFILPHFTSINIDYLQPSFEKNFWFNLVCYVFIIPNVAYAFFKPVPHIGQTWSIGVEEQFYIVWPILILKSKNKLRAILVFIFLVLLVKIITWIVVRIDSALISEELVKLIAMMKLESMGIGAIGAILLSDSKYSDLLKKMSSDFLSLIGLFLLPIIIYLVPEKFNDGVHIAYSFIFLQLLINVTINQESRFILGGKFTDTLGKISYGFYMYHFMIIPIIILFSKKLGYTGVLQSVLIYSISFILTTVISYISYNYFEKKFFKLKSKFSVIESTN